MTEEKHVFVVLRDISEKCGDYYTASLHEQFLGIVNTRETARNIIEYLADNWLDSTEEFYIDKDLGNEIQVCGKTEHIDEVRCHYYFMEYAIGTGGLVSN